MKRDEVLEIFPEATDEQVDAILNKNGSDINPLKTKLKAAEDERDKAQAALDASKASEAAVKAQLDEANAKLEEGMSAEELLAAREKAAVERERDFTLKSNGLDAREIFVQSGFFEKDEIEAFVKQVTEEDAEKTKASAQLIVDAVSKQRDAVAKATKAEVLKGNPKPEGGEGGAMTKKDFKNLSLEEQIAMKRENPEIMAQLA